MQKILFPDKLVAKDGTHPAAFPKPHPVPTRPFEAVIGCDRRMGRTRSKAAEYYVLSTPFRISNQYEHDFYDLPWGVQYLLRYHKSSGLIFLEFSVC